MENTKPVLKKVKCGTVALQQLRRIALPTVITDNMDIREGDELSLYYDPDAKAAVLVKAPTANEPAARPYKKARSK